MSMLSRRLAAEPQATGRYNGAKTDEAVLGANLVSVP